MPDPNGQLRFERLVSPGEHVQGELSALLKPEEVRLILNVSRSWLYEAANTGRIPSVRLGPDGPLRFDLRRSSGGWRAAVTASGARADAPDRCLGLVGSGLLEGRLEMAVVALGGRDRAVAELALHVDERLAGQQPRRGRGVAQGVQRHVPQAGVLQRRLVPLARHCAPIHRLPGSPAAPTAEVGLEAAHGSCRLPWLR